MNFGLIQNTHKKLFQTQILFPPKIQTHFYTETLWYPYLPHANLCIFHLHTNSVTRDCAHPKQICQKNTKIYKYKNIAVKFEFQISNRYNLNMSQILHCCCSVIKSCLTICNPMNCTMPGFPVHHYLPEFAQTHVHWVSDAIQLSHPLLPLFSPALNLSQYQGLFQWIGSSHQMAKVLEL